MAHPHSSTHLLKKIITQPSSHSSLIYRKDLRATIQVFLLQRAHYEMPSEHPIPCNRQEMVSAFQYNRYYPNLIPDHIKVEIVGYAIPPKSREICTPLALGWDLFFHPTDRPRHPNKEISRGNPLAPKDDFHPFAIQ